MLNLIIFFLFTLSPIKFQEVKWEMYKNYVSKQEIWLFMDDMNLVSIKGLKKYTDLTRLSLNENQLNEVGEISFLINLKWLHLSSNQIQSLMGLGNLTQLNWFDFDSNKIESLEGIEKLTQLNVLNLIENNIKSLEGLENLVNLTHCSFF